MFVQLTFSRTIRVLNARSLENGCRYRSKYSKGETRQSGSNDGRSKPPLRGYTRKEDYSGPSQ